MKKEESWDQFLRNNASSAKENKSPKKHQDSTGIESLQYARKRFDESVPPRRVESLLTSNMTSLVMDEKICLGCLHEWSSSASDEPTRSSYVLSQSTFNSESWNVEKSCKGNKTLRKPPCRCKKTGKKASLPTGVGFSEKPILRKRSGRRVSRSSGSGSSRESLRRQKYVSFNAEEKIETVNTGPHRLVEMHGGRRKVQNFLRFQLVMKASFKFSASRFLSTDVASEGLLGFSGGLRKVQSV